MSRDFTPQELHAADRWMGFMKNPVTMHFGDGRTFKLYDPEDALTKRYPNFVFLSDHEAHKLFEKFGKDAYPVLDSVEKELVGIIQADDDGNPCRMETPLEKWYFGKLDLGFYYHERNNELLSEWIAGEIRKRKGSGCGTYSLIHYFDVWGNAEDGWEVNNQSVECEDLVISDDATDKDIMDYLVQTGYLTEKGKDLIEIEENGDFIEIVLKSDGMPVYSLRPVKKKTHTSIKRTITVSKKEAELIDRLLSHKPENEDECFGEDDHIIYTAVFENGMEVDVKLCGVQYEEGVDNLPWTEAVLFKDGSEVCCTDVGEEYFGTWTLENDGVTYIVTVERQKEDDR